MSLVAYCQWFLFLKIIRFNMCSLCVHVSVIINIINMIDWNIFNIKILHPPVILPISQQPSPVISSTAKSNSSIKPSYKGTSLPETYATTTTYAADDDVNQMSSSHQNNSPASTCSPGMYANNLLFCKISYYAFAYSSSLWIFKYWEKCI